MQDTHQTEEHQTESSPGLRLWLWRWFWRVTLVVSLGYAWYCFYVPQNNIAWADKYPSPQARSVHGEPHAVLFFTGKWCVPCRIMKRTVWADEEVEALVNSKFTPILIDVGDPGEFSDAVDRYNVYVTPTTIVTDADGNVLGQVQGRMTKAEFLAMLEKPTTHAP